MPPIIPMLSLLFWVLVAELIVAEVVDVLDEDIEDEDEDKDRSEAAEEIEVNINAVVILDVEAVEGLSSSRHEPMLHGSAEQQP
ncbi:hypothetical protein EYZ11_002058 [Aspergillus tanneri]|uniref:Secreted protein n=1 Tax=Aspergillus tanneri TaxID=1220188 RepID=A0A4S3JRP0_9EURO|nr:hypothetical protein EYZ11_002058 [Aspergillus tanneri]